MRLNKEQINKIKELREKGLSYKKIAESVKTSIQTVNYHLNPKTREYSIRVHKEIYKKMPIEKRRELAKKHLAYQRTYQKNKYHSDELFRKKMIEANKLCQKKRKKQ